MVVRLAVSIVLAGVLSSAIAGPDGLAEASSPDTALSAPPSPCPVAETRAIDGSRARRDQIGIGGRGEAPKARFALTLPDGWLWVATELSDIELLGALVIEADAERGPVVAELLSALPCAGRIDSVTVLDVEAVGDTVHYGSRYFWLADERQSMLSCLDVQPHPDHWLPIAEAFEPLTEEEER